MPRISSRRGPRARLRPSAKTASIGSGFELIDSEIEAFNDLIATLCSR